MKYVFVATLLVAQIVSGQSSLRVQNPPAKESDSFLTGHYLSSLSLPHSDLLKLDESNVSGKKNVTLAVLYSLLLPGMGELYAGNYSTGKYFTIAEGGLWITLGAVQWYATGLQDDARRFAVQHAQINLDGKDDQYFVDIGEFQNINDYNEQILRNRDAHKVYDLQTFYWNWDSDANRGTFDDLRVASDEKFNDVRFVAAAIGVNHLISAINAARIAISHNHSVHEASLLNMKAGVLGGLAHPNGIVISVSKNF
jgi:hypothetical protein